MTDYIRHIGIDLGNTYSRAFFTATDSETGELSEPRRIRYGNNSYIQSTVISHPQSPTNKILKSADILLEVPASEIAQLAIRRNIKANLVHGVDEGLAVLVEALKVGVMRHLNVQSLPPAEFKIMFGIPANWTGTDQAFQTFKRLSEGVFDQPEFYPDAAAAILGAANVSILPLRDGFQSWIVADFGGVSTRFSLIKKDKFSLKPTVADSFVGTWSGDELDRLLRDQWFLPSYDSQIAESVKGCEDLLVLIMRNLKESLIKDGFYSEANYGSLGIRDLILLDKETFEKKSGHSNRIMLQEMFQNPRLALPEWDEAEFVLLVGGSTVWDVVLQETYARWGADRVIIPQDPDLLVVRGLALASGGMSLKPNALGLNKPKIETTIADPPAPTLPPGPSKASTPNKAALRQKVHKMIGNYALGCAGVALALAWLPFAAWPILMAIEVYMLLEIAKLYGYRYTNGLFISMTIGLLLASLALSFLLAPITESVLCMVKPILAGLIAWGIGEGGVAILEWDSARQH